MQVDSLIREAVAAGVELWLEEGERLKFRAPRDSLAPDRMALLKTHKAEIIRRLRADPTLAARRFPMSQGQQALWFVQQSAPQSSAYHVVMCQRLHPVGADEIRALLQSMMDRHPGLRTTFELDQGRPVQVIHPRLALPYGQLDASGWSEERLMETLQANVRLPFDLEREAPIRALIATTGPDEQVMLVTIHHIVCDLWSIGLFAAEATRRLEAQAAGVVLDLPTPAPYTDFVAWQEGRLAEAEGERQWRYWQERLGDTPTVLDLPTDRLRPPAQRLLGASCPIRLDEGLSSRLRLLAREQGVTSFVLLLAAFQTLLHRYAGQEEIWVGTPTVGRNDPRFRGTMGYFVNPVVLRGDLSGDPSFIELLPRVRETVLGAMQHQEFPFPLLVKRLHPHRDSSRSPLFQVSFILQRIQVGGVEGGQPSAADGTWMEAGGIRITTIELPQQEGQFDLLLELFEYDQGFAGHLKYNTDLYDAATMARMAAHLQTLLAGIADDATRPLSQLPLMTEAEQRLLTAWNRTERAWPDPQGFPEQFEAQAARTPTAPALSYRGETLSYAELDAQSNRLAHHLRSLGVGAESLVGISLSRGPDLIIAILAVFKAGGAYLPLDPAYPLERLRFMLEDAAVGVLLTHAEIAPSLLMSGPGVVLLDNAATAFAHYPATRPELTRDADSLAYVIYTSGSTGRPKGTLIPHLGLGNLARTMIEQCEVGQESRVLQFTSASFDVSVAEYAMALSSGACLCLADREEIMPGPPLAALLQRERITHVILPPSALTRLPPEVQGEPLTIIVAGEASPPELVDRWSSGRPFFNGYGPTENTVLSTIYRQPESGPGEMPLGPPMPNARAYVLDPKQNPLPIGVWGELYLGGVGVARGYLNRPELSAERFIEREVLGRRERLYRTGDRVRWRGDGNLEFQGRIDSQVKLRGFRIELGEVEAVLSRHPSVREAVAAVREDRPGDPRLVAYVIPSDGLDIAALREFVKRQVPEFMVPAVFVVVEQLPRSPAGKVDRIALPAPEYSGDASGAPPTDALERDLVAIWGEELGVEQLGIHDDFFELGGHSLLAVCVADRVRRRTGRTLPVTMLIQHPTVARLAEFLRTSTDAAVDDVLIPLAENGALGPPLFLVHPIGGGVSCYQTLADRLAPYRAVFGLRSPVLDGQPPFTSIPAMAAAYVKALRRHQPEGPYRLGGWSLGGMVAYEMALQLAACGQRTERLYLIDSFTPETIRNARKGVAPTLDTAALFDREIGAFTVGEGSKQLLRSIFDAHLAAIDIYRPQRHSGPAMLLRAEHSNIPARSGDNGWGELVGDRLRVSTITGDHYTIFAEPGLGELADHLIADLGSSVITAQSGVGPLASADRADWSRHDPENIGAVVR